MFTSILSALHCTGYPSNIELSLKFYYLYIKPSIIWPLNTWQTCSFRKPLYRALRSSDLCVYSSCLDLDLKNEVIALWQLQVRNSGTVYLFILAPSISAFKSTLKTYLFSQYTLIIVSIVILLLLCFKFDSLVLFIFISEFLFYSVQHFGQLRLFFKLTH